MTWCKADVPDHVARALNAEAAKRGVTISDVITAELEAWYEQSEYDLEGTDDDYTSGIDHQCHCEHRIRIPVADHFLVSPHPYA